MRRKGLLAGPGIVVLLAGLAMPQGAFAQSSAGLSVGDAPTSEAVKDGEPATTRPRERTRRFEVNPYIEVSQNALMTRTGSRDEVVTYTAVAAGVTTRIETRAISVTTDMRYQHQFSLDNSAPDQDVFTGLANGRIKLVRDELTLEGGLLGTRVRVGDFAGANNSLAGTRFTSNVYSTYIGPDLKTRIGDLAVKGSYRFGYNKVESRAPALAFENAATGTFDQSTIHKFGFSVGARPEVMLPFGWSLSLGYTRESSNQLDQRFVDKFMRLELTQPVSPTLAMVGSIGYQDVVASNRDVLRDDRGFPLRDDRGRLVMDPASPRHLAYDNSHTTWDAGVLWRPSDRTTLEARAGHRYGSMSYSGSFSWRPGGRSSIHVGLFDSVDSFGRALNGALANLPGDFSVSRNPFSGDIAGCAFSLQSGDSCFVDTLTGIGTANYRNRGIYAQLAHMSGDWTFNAAMGYSRRKFLASGSSVLAAINGVSDVILYANVNLTRTIGAKSAIDANVYINNFNPGFVNQATMTNIGAYAGYHRRVGRSFIVNASAGVDTTRESGLDNVLVVLAQLGIRYQF